MPDSARNAGTELNGTGLTRGDAKWIGSRSVTLGENGVTTSTPAGAHHEIPAVAGIIKVKAEVSADGSGFAGVALGKGNLSSSFWANLSMVFYINGNRYNLTVGGKNLVTTPDLSAMKQDGLNELELEVNTIARTVTARLNGKTVVDASPLPASVNPGAITAAGFRFNEPLKSGVPYLRNYRAEVTNKATTGLEATDVGMCFVAPDKEATLRWKVKSPGPSAQVPYTVADFEGRQVAAGNAALGTDRTVTISRAFPRGYSEVRFPEAGQTFGIVSLEPTAAGPADPFFGMDAGLSWLELDPARRASLVRILARSGITMARERLGLGSVNPAKGTYNWDTRRQFDAVRANYAESKVQVLEILDGGGRHHDLQKETWYANNLPELAETTAEVTRHWPVWGAAEVCNEPDLKGTPADQYIPIVKAMSYGLKQAPTSIPLVTGVFANIPPGPYFDTSAANGLLDDSNAISFHSYDRAPAVEGMVARYRTWLKSTGKEAMPMWHTECGWAWGVGPDRPPVEQDTISALEISAKAMESKVCGVARFFPFVYVYYEEGHKNFGMMGREATPLRSMAGYATTVQMLSGKSYLGDLTGDGVDKKITLARVFGRPAKEGEGEAVVVIYTGSVKPIATVSLPVKVKRVQGADGRTLTVQNAQSDQSIGVVASQVPVPDGIAYITVDRAGLGAFLKTDTSARRLYEIGQQPLVQQRLASPLVLQFLWGKTPSRASARRYLVSRETAKALPLNVRIHNMSQAPIMFTPELILPGGKLEKGSPVSVPAMGFSDIQWQPDVTGELDIARTKLITVGGKAESGISPSPLAIPLMMEGTLEQHLSKHPRQAVMPISDVSRWKVNISEHGKSIFSATAGGGWKMDATFPGKTGSWTYPKFTLSEKADPSLYSGLLVRARLANPASGVAIIAGTSDESPSFWVTDLFPADGEWHVVYVPFAEFKPGPNGVGNQNTRLNTMVWKDLGIGMGSRTAENTLEVSHLLLVGGSGE
ncbi:MAG TPA: hypothetical protein VK970_06460 [Candidatus Methylacidiphilales bacterium]|nr:hypothetical protein [Candidatus Methylacidiphilales bacterium]